MSTILMISLAIAIIFWQAPFQLPRPSRKIIDPIVIIIIISSLLLIGTFKSSSKESCINQTAKQVGASDTLLRPSAY